MSRGCRSRSHCLPLSHAGLREKSPAQSRSSCSPYRKSSRCGSAPPGDSKRHSRSCSCSASWRMDEDRQEEQSSLDFVSVVAHMRSVSELLEAPSENRKIHGFRVALEDDDQLVSSYRLPFDDASVDILTDIDSHISSPSSGMSLKKVSKLLL